MRGVAGVVTVRRGLPAETVTGAPEAATIAAV
jgi:hypothetical protein